MTSITDVPFPILDFCSAYRDIRRGCRSQSEPSRERAEPGCFIPRVVSAFFVGIIQVLVYAGAVMVLFLFIIMLLDIHVEERRRINWVAAVGGTGVAVILLVQICVVIGHFQSARRIFPPLATSTTDDVWHIGRLLFNNYNLPFQIIGVLVLVATIGVVLLSRREPR
jgi:NADH-quinone oxidoreductase subunit J